MSLRPIAVKTGRRHRRRRFSKICISVVLVLIAASPLGLLCYLSSSSTSLHKLTWLPALFSLDKVEPSFDYRAARKIHPYSVVPGGVLTIAEVESSIAADSVVARHYRDIHAENLLLRRTPGPMEVFVSYRIQNAIYWSSRKIRLPKGELLLVDGKNMTRASCGNRLVFQLPPESPNREPPPIEPPLVVLEQGSPPLPAPGEPLVPTLELLPRPKPGVWPPAFVPLFACCDEYGPGTSSPPAVATPEPSPLLLLGTGVLLLVLRAKPWKRRQ
jgi:hypothetical protein